MSRHYFNCKCRGADVRVILGYDRPLDEFFLMIEKLTAQRSPTSSYLYASISDPDNEPDDLDYYRQRLKTLGIAVPVSLFESVEEDAIEQRGNYVVEHLADATARVVYDERAVALRTGREDRS